MFMRCRKALTTRSGNYQICSDSDMDQEQCIVFLVAGLHRGIRWRNLPSLHAGTVAPVQ